MDSTIGGATQAGSAELEASVKRDRDWWMTVAVCAYGANLACFIAYIVWKAAV